MANIKFMDFATTDPTGNDYILIGDSTNGVRKSTVTNIVNAGGSSFNNRLLAIEGFATGAFSPNPTYGSLSVNTNRIVKHYHYAFANVAFISSATVPPNGVIATVSNDFHCAALQMVIAKADSGEVYRFKMEGNNLMVADDNVPSGKTVRIGLVYLCVPAEE